MANTAAVKIKPALPKEEDENGLDWNTSRVFLKHPTEQHIIVAYVHTGQVIEDYDGDFGSRTPVLVFDAVEWMGSILEAPEHVRHAFQARHAKRTGSAAMLPIDEPAPPHRVLHVSHEQLMEQLAGFDLDMDTLTAMEHVDLATGEVIDGPSSREDEWSTASVTEMFARREAQPDVALAPYLAESMDEVRAEWAVLSFRVGTYTADGSLAAGLALARVGTRRIDRYAAGTAADLWPSDPDASLRTRYACAVLLEAATDGHEELAATIEALRDWTLADDQLGGYLLDPAADRLATWSTSHVGAVR